MEEELENEEVEEIRVERPQEMPVKPKDDGISDLFTVPKDDISDLGRVTDEDVIGEGGNVDDLVDVPEEEEVGDLFKVTKEDVMGRQRKKVVKPQYRRTVRRYIPPTSLGGIQ